MPDEQASAARCCPQSRPHRSWCPQTRRRRSLMSISIAILFLYCLSLAKALVTAHCLANVSLVFALVVKHRNCRMDRHPKKEVWKNVFSEQEREVKANHSVKPTPDGVA